jgi:HEAT repeat protein
MVHRHLAAHSLAAVLAACSVGAGCSSSGTAEAKDGGRTEPIAGLVEATNTPPPIGKLLADLDGQIRAWNTLFLSAQSAEDRRKARLLEDSLSATAHKHRQDLVLQLESGPLSNRVIAASALGFTRNPEALSPLIAALEDPHDEVVGNALLGLMLLGQKDTPLDPICRLLRDSRDEGVRRNAAQCLRSLVADTGASAECVRTTARLGLSDMEPGVRSQCVAILATLLDQDSLSAICDRLYDQTPLVVAAAARALSYFGAASPPDKGTCARALAKAFADLRGPMRTQVRRSLIEIAGVDHGNGEEDWMNWALRLP